MPSADLRQSINYEQYPRLVHFSHRPRGAGCTKTGAGGKSQFKVLGEQGEELFRRCDVTRFRPAIGIDDT